MTEQAKTEQLHRKTGLQTVNARRYVLFFIITVLLSLGTFYGAYLFSGIGYNGGALADNPEARVGFASGVVASVALGLLIVSLIFQFNELRATREELRLTHVELEAQKNEFEESNALSKKQLFDSTFFNLLAAYKGALDRFECLSVTGEPAEGQLLLRGEMALDEYLKNLHTVRQATPVRAAELSAEGVFYDLSAVMLPLFTLADYLCSHGGEGLDDYAGMLRSLLGTRELAAMCVWVKSAPADAGYMKTMERLSLLGMFKEKIAKRLDKLKAEELPELKLFSSYEVMIGDFSPAAYGFTANSWQQVNSEGTSFE